MKKYLYAAIPIVAFLLILTNMFFGHELFASPTEQVANKYSIYVHLQPEWKSDNKNVIFDVTNSWYKAKQDDIYKNSIFNAKDTQYNENQLHYINDKSFVRLSHGFSDCQAEWQPMLYRKAIDTVRHEIEYMQGSQLSTDPNISVYPDIENDAYSSSEQQEKITNGYAQFIPICTLNDKTSYEYSVKTDNPAIGFDVYFIKSMKEYDNFFANDSTFDYYDNEGCYGQNKQSYSGICKDIASKGGLLIVIPDELNPWITKIAVNLYEISDS